MSAADRARHAHRVPGPANPRRFWRGLLHGLLIEAIAVAVIVGVAWYGARI